MCTKPPGRAHFPRNGSTSRRTKSTLRSPSSKPKTTQSTVTAGRGYSYVYFSFIVHSVICTLTERMSRPPPQNRYNPSLSNKFGGPDVYKSWRRFQRENEFTRSGCRCHSHRAGKREHGSV